MDFRKALDSVSHDILHYAKTFACGLNGQLSCWSQSYVSSRQQFVELNGVLSPPPEVRYGVPLGSR